MAATSSSVTNGDSSPRTRSVGTMILATSSHSGVKSIQEARAASSDVVAHAATDAGGGPERAEGDGGVGHLLEAVVDGRSGDEGDGAAFGRSDRQDVVVDVGRDLDEDDAAAELRALGGQADERGAAEGHPDEAAGGGSDGLDEGRDGL